MNDLQRTDEWYQARLGKATASKFNKVFTSTGKKSTQWKKYMYQLLAERMTGQCPEFSNSATDWGNTYESEAMLAYERETFREIKSTGFLEYSGDNELLRKYVGGSPDGLIGEDGGVEFKCPHKSEIHVETAITKKVPAEYYPQVQGGLWLSDRKWWDFVSYDPRANSNQLVIVRVERNEEFIQGLELALIEFCENLDNQIKFLKL